MTAKGPFQPKTFYDSMITGLLHYYVTSYEMTINLYLFFKLLSAQNKVYSVY